MNKKEYDCFAWIDMKTTGNNPHTDKITEISLKITDGDMNVIDNKGFNVKVDNDIKKAEQLLIEYISKVLPNGEKPPIAGYNVSEKERPFIEVQLKELKSKSIHYRNLDVSSIEMVSKNIYSGLSFPKDKEDKEGIELIDISIDNINFLKNRIFKKVVCVSKNNKMVSKNKDQEIPYMIWTDLETTGLDPKKNNIIEIATIITDGNLNIIDDNCFQEIIKIDQNIINNGAEIAIKMHKENGLLDKCLNADDFKTIKNAEAKVIEAIRKIIPEGIKAPLAGNTIGSLDKPFIKEHMPSLNKTSLTKTNIDVTSFTMLAKNFVEGLEMPKKRRNHLAMEDIKDSIEELRFIRDNALQPIEKVIKKRKNKKSIS